MSTQDETLPEDVRQAVEEARASLEAQYAPFGLEPPIVVAEAYGIPCVLLPWPIQRRNQALRQASGKAELERGVALAESVVVDCAFWVRGQQEPGRVGAVKHLRSLAQIGYSMIFDKLGGEYLRVSDEVGGSTAAKKL